MSIIYYQVKYRRILYITVFCVLTFTSLFPFIEDTYRETESIGIIRFFDTYPGRYFLYANSIIMLLLIINGIHVYYRAIFNLPAMESKDGNIHVHSWESFVISEEEIKESEFSYDSFGQLVIKSPRRRKPLKIDLRLFDGRRSALELLTSGRGLRI